MDDEYRFIKPSTDKEYIQLYGVMESAFPNEDVVSIVRRFAEKHPTMTSDDFFMVMHGNRPVAGLVLIPQEWSIDGSEVRVAEMGCVGTIPEYRRRRLQYILNEKFDEYARGKGYDLCALAGIPYFYRQFGYQYAVELDYMTKIEVNRLPTNSGLTRRPFKTEDIQVAKSLLERIQRRYMVHSVRTHDIWLMQEETGTYGAEPFQGTVLQEGDEVVAYYRAWVDRGENTLLIKELAQRDEQITPKIAAAIKEEAEKQGLEKIKTKLSHEDAFSKYLIGLGAEKNKPYAWQVKILDLKGFLRKLAPVLERRLKNSEFKGLTKMLQMNFWKYSLELRFEDGKLVSIEESSEPKRILGMNPYASIQLFLGYRSREELEHMYPDFYIRGGNGELIDILFPRSPGYIHYSY